MGLMATRNKTTFDKMQGMKSVSAVLKLLVFFDETAWRGLQPPAEIY
jgi:hypothetical protein